MPYYEAENWHSSEQRRAGMRDRSTSYCTSHNSMGNHAHVSTWPGSSKTGGLLGSFLIHFADHKGLGIPPLSRLSSRVAHAAVQRAIIAEAPGCLLPRMLPRAEEQQSPGPEQCRHRGQRRDEPLQWLTWAAGQGDPSFCPALGQSPWSHRPLGARLTTETWSNEHPGWHAPN